ncbi:MAG: MFS transporter [Bacteroidota bacterium]|nr:MFS transporter [Bacteroidota bacterium]
MNAPTYLKPWLGEWSWGMKISLFLILLSAVVQFAAFSLSQTYVISYFGAQPEDISFSIQLTYAGILTTLPIQTRLQRHFEMKGYLILLIFSGILLSAACIYINNIVYFFIVRFLQGVVICSVATCMLTLIANYLRLEFKQVVGASIFYGTVLSSSVLIGLVAGQVTLNSNFVNLYNYLIIFQVIILVIVLVGFNSKSGIRPYPLYQIDFTGAVFFVLAAVGFAYTIIYGSKYYWFTDNRIIFSATITISGLMLYVWRELTVKRPLVDLKVFKYRNFWIGLIMLALYYGTKESINLIYGYTASVLQWSEPQVITLGLVNIAGLIIFMAMSAAILVKRKDVTLGFVICGFSMLLLYHLWMYFIFTPDLSFGDLILPLFFQGAASGILFVPIMIFMLNSVPQNTGITGLTMAACTRFASLLNAGAGFYNLQLYYNQLYRESFLARLTNDDQPTADRLAGFNQLFQSKGYSADQANALSNISLSKLLVIQGQLLTNRAVFLFIAAMIAVILLLALLVFIIQTFLKRRTTGLAV